MHSKKFAFRSLLLGAVLLGIASLSAFAGSAVIGLVAGSSNATLSGRAMAPNTPIFSGDTIQVRDGVAVVAVGSSSRMAFGRETIASFLRDSNEVTVLLSQGNVSLSHPDDSVALRIKAGEVSIAPAMGFKTLGDVAMLNGSIVVTAKEGLLRVEGNGSAVEVAKGKTITLPTKAAKAPAGAAAGAGARISSTLALNIASASLAGLGAVEGAVAISRANDAKDAANAANATAAQAVTSANAATAAANAATTAANAATAAANAAQATANLAGCALDKAFPNVSPSPFTPPKGSTCP